MLISSRSVNKHGHYRQFLFPIGWFLKKYSPLKPISQMNRNLVGSTYGRFCIKFLQDRRWVTQAQPTEPLVREISCYLFPFIHKWHVTVQSFSVSLYKHPTTILLERCAPKGCRKYCKYALENNNMTMN